MPELPEVQVVIDFLKTKVLNKEIKNVDILIKKILKNVDEQTFKDIIVSSKILDIKRKGKYLLFYLDNNYLLVVHLRMEGKFFIVDDLNDELKKHAMVCFNFKDFKLIYHDTRRFGTFHLIKQNELESFETLTKVEIDPLNDLFDAKFLFNKIKNKNKYIKTTLLDQSVVSGIGNIYADEILFKSKIHPLTLAKKLTLKDCELICKYSKEILSDSIKHNGTTVHSFKFNGIDSGEYQNYLQIHSNKIKSCLVCKQPIEFIKVNGRGTFVCNKCQNPKK